MRKLLAHKLPTRLCTFAIGMCAVFIALTFARNHIPRDASELTAMLNSPQRKHDFSGLF